MKIGILTYHRSHNYGALLQAYALKNFLIQQGYNDVEFVDYYPDYQTRMYANKLKPISDLSFKQILKYPLYLFFEYFPLFGFKEKRKRNFNMFIKKYLINSKRLANEYFDIIIYGSDQIWRKQRQKICPGFNEVYFGDSILKAKKRIVFSASMGLIDLEPTDKLFLSNSFKNFTAISVREKDLFEVIKSFSNYPVKHTLDPVFLLTSKDWERIIPKRIIKARYILFYNLQENEEAKRIAENIGSQLGSKIIESVGTIRKKNLHLADRLFDGPQNFLSLIRYSDFVVTSSFHGVCLSIIFNKQFYACLKQKSSRVTSLLELFGIENRFINDTDDIKLTDHINYNKISDTIYCERNKTINYLLSSIEN